MAAIAHILDVGAKTGAHGLAAPGRKAVFVVSPDQAFATLPTVFATLHGLSPAESRLLTQLAVGGRANAALNVLHIGGAFLIQSGIGMVVGLWGTDAAGHSPTAAYVVAFALNLLPQCLALAWFAAAPALWTRSGGAVEMGIATPGRGSPGSVMLRTHLAAGNDPMAIFTWNGKSGAYLDPAQWTPAAVPLYGEDTAAVIADGTAALSDAAPNGIALVLGRTLAQPTLRLSTRPSARR